MSEKGTFAVKASLLTPPLLFSRSFEPCTCSTHRWGSPRC